MNTRRVRTVLAGLVTVGFVVVSSAAAAAKGSHVHGDWKLTVKGPAAHGDMEGTLQLKQEKAKVTGSFGMHGQSHPVTGEFKDGTLSLETTDTPADKVVSFTAELKKDGTLAGHVSTPMGDMRWTAVRAAETR